ncbi:MAG: hypothetical protein HY791_31385 [Deltaproteobacteria bacterium]|nr:hypothetical protein [Deltaproteobacteria bacterium]
MLVSTSAADRMVSSKCSRAISARYQAPIAVSAGHELALDDPEWVADALVGFVAATGSDRGAG